MLSAVEMCVKRKHATNAAAAAEKTTGVSLRNGRAGWEYANRLISEIGKILHSDLARKVAAQGQIAQEREECDARLKLVSIGAVLAIAIRSRISFR
jgi:hypothetical protein